MQEPDTSARWRLALADSQMTCARFSGALGIDLDAAELPITIHLLNRMERDVLDTAFNAKIYFNRPRPFQRFAAAHVCGADSLPHQKLIPTEAIQPPPILQDIPRLVGALLSRWQR